MRGDLPGHLIAFQYVLQRADLESEVVGHAQQHQDFIGPIAMRMHVALAFQHFHQGLQLQIAARRDRLLVAIQFGLVIAPFFLVGARLGKGFPDDVLHAHAGGGIT